MNTDYLKTMDKAWHGTAAKENKYSDLPEGIYQCKIETAQIKESRQGNPILQWGLRIVSSEYANRMAFKTQALTPESLPYLKSDLDLLGICPENLSDLEKQLPFALDAVIDIRIKNKVLKDGTSVQNVYFNRLVKAGRRTVQTDGFTVVSNDDLPWEN